MFLSSSIHHQHDRSVINLQTIYKCTCTVFASERTCPNDKNVCDDVTVVFLDILLCNPSILMLDNKMVHFCRISCKFDKFFAVHFRLLLACSAWLPSIVINWLIYCCTKKMSAIWREETLSEKRVAGSRKKRLFRSVQYQQCQNALDVWKRIDADKTGYVIKDH